MLAADRIQPILVQVFVVLLLLCVSRVRGQATNDTGQGRAECQQVLMKEVYTCVNGNGIDFNAFLEMVSGGKDAQNATTTATTSPPATAASNTSNVTTATTSLPATAALNTSTVTTATTSPPTTAAPNTSNVNLSKDKICGPRQEIMGCIVKAAQTIFKSSPCVAVKTDATLNDQRFLIKEQLEAIIGQYDVFCAHPCRLSLLDDMRACYTKNDLDPQLFMSADASGPVIGSRTSDVEEFCENSESLYKCLLKSRDDCQESHVVLSSIGLDLELMNKGVEVLCADKKAYMQSLDCFDSHTKEVENCQSVKYRTILAMAIKARTQSWTEGQYYQEVCGVILRHIQCDLNAWGAKSDKDCTEDTLNLKRKLHCTLIPQQCQTSHNATAAEVCTIQKRSTGVKVTQYWAIVILLSFLLVWSVDTYN